MSGAAENQGTPSQRETHLQQAHKAAGDVATSTTTSGDVVTPAEGGSGAGESSKTQDESPRSASSPEPNCAICLGTLENKSFTDSCFHMFCFVCLQEWSKVKAECPLCKQPFKSIIHNVRSYNNYDQFYLDHHRTDPRHTYMHGWNRPFHHYRSTLTMDHRYMRIQIDHDLRLRSHPYQRGAPDPDDSLQRPSRQRRSQRPRLWPHHVPATTTVDFRRRIYERGYRVTCVQTSQRYRQVSPEFFSSNPAQTHRLIPWLNRELNALLYCHESQVQFVMELILDLIKRFAIDSEEFYQHISPYIGCHTRHFMHELLSFARSPFHMPTYDTKAIYEPYAQLVSSSETSDNESDVVVIDDDDAEEAGRPGEERREAPGPSGQGHFREPPSVRFGLDASYLSTPAAPSQLRALLEGTSSNTHSSSRWDSATLASGWDSPTPGPSWGMGHGTASSSPVNVEDSSDSDASTIIDPTYLPPQLKDEADSRTRDESDSNGEDVIFVGYDKPWEERSPIHLSSDSEDEVLSKFAKKLKHEHKKKTEESAGLSSESHSSRSRHQERSGSLTPPDDYRRRSRSSHSRPGSKKNRRPSLEGSSHRQADGHHYRRKHFEKSEKVRSSSDPTTSTSSREKRSHSSSSQRFKPGHKKRRRDKADDADDRLSNSHKKKHKYKKKHKKHKDRRDGNEDPKRHKESQSSSKVSHKDYNSASSSSRDHHSRMQPTESFKKHPSGHKKSRVQDSGDLIADERGSGQVSDVPSSNCSSNATTSTATVSASALSLSCQSSDPYPLWSPLRMLMSETLPQRSDPAFPTMDMPSTWENIKRLAGLLSISATAPQPALGIPGPGQSTREPLVIPSSSDESDREEASQEGADSRIEFRSGDGFAVAETVVVPCSSRFGVPTDAVDSSAATSSADEEELIDVDSVSSCDKSTDSESDEIVDVESVEETEKEEGKDISTDTSSSLDRGGCAVAEVSAEPDIPLPAFFKTVSAPPAVPPHRFSIDSILNRDVFMGFGASSLPSFDQVSVSSPSTSRSQDVPCTHSQSQVFSSLPEFSCSSFHSQHYSPEPTVKVHAARGSLQRVSTSAGSLQQNAADAAERPTRCTNPRDEHQFPSTSKPEDVHTPNLYSCSGVGAQNSGQTGSDIDGFSDSDTEEEIDATKREFQCVGTSNHSREGDDKSCYVDSVRKVCCENEGTNNCEPKYPQPSNRELSSAVCSEFVNETAREKTMTLPPALVESGEAGCTEGSQSTSAADAQSKRLVDVSDSSSNMGVAAHDLGPAADHSSQGNPDSSSGYELTFSFDERDAGEPHITPSLTCKDITRRADPGPDNVDGSPTQLVSPQHPGSDYSDAVGDTGKSVASSEKLESPTHLVLDDDDLKLNMLLNPAISGPMAVLEDPKSVADSQDAKSERSPVSPAGVDGEMENTSTFQSGKSELETASSTGCYQGSHPEMVSISDTLSYCFVATEDLDSETAQADHRFTSQPEVDLDGSSNDGKTEA